MYQALYRKWRPKTFEDVVGQAHITETLRRQVAEDRLSHAYLFTGTRGTGKTTCAKILAKAVNCRHPVNGDPCNQCDACLGIDNGSLLDVLELDAASNNGVDHVRALRDEAIYSPANVRYRVYIVDEVHMLSTAAFNALLKILEEPPAHLIFILATTELHKVPATILSRCQRFAFKRIQPEDIAKRLLYVASQEGMTLTEDAAELLSRLSDGALRDALSLLDQCSGGKEINKEHVLDVLGLAGNLQTAQMMKYILSRETQAALLLLNQLYQGGKDVSALLGELSTLARDLLIRATAPEGGAALLSGGYDTAMMDGLSAGITPTRLIHITTRLQDTLAALPLSANRRTDAELCLMRLCDESLCGDLTALAARVARLEEGGLREPCVIRWPGRVQPGSLCHDYFTTPDFYPTLLEAAGLPLRPEQHVDGVSIMPSLSGGRLDRGPIFWHYPHYSNQGGTPGCAMRLGDYKLIEQFESRGTYQLYNLRDDPSETVNLAGREPARVRELAAMLNRWRDTEVQGYVNPINPAWDPWD